MSRFFLLSMCIGLFATSFLSVLAEEKQGPSEIGRFSNLSSTEQKNILIGEFSKRINFAKNLFYRNEIRLQGHKNSNGKLGEIITNSVSRRNYAHWQYYNDYRFDIAFFDPNKKDSFQWVTACWDSKEGICKNTVKNERLDRTFARIDTVVDEAILLNDVYTFWLQGGSTETFPIPPYLFHHLLKHQDEWTITSPFESSNIRLVLAYDAGKRYSTAVQGEGKITIILDPEKHYMPHHVILRGDVTMKDGRHIWREETITVEESKLVDTTWMPTKLTASLQASAYPDNRFMLTFSTISEMEHGKVKKSDVTMKFPEGTEVTDAINGISYKTNAHGEPIPSTIQPLYGLNPSQVKMPEKKRGMVNYVMMVSGLIMIAIALYMQFNKRRRVKP